MVLGGVMEIGLRFVLNLVMMINLPVGSRRVNVHVLANRKTPAHRWIALRV